LDALGFEQRLVDFPQDLAALIVLEQHGDLLWARRLDQVVDHAFAEAVGPGIPVPGADDEVVVGLADKVVDARSPAHQQELAVELLGIGQDGYEYVGQKRTEDEPRPVLFQQSLELDGGLLGITPSVKRDELELVGL